jgi:nucleotide-binding universal stress UspA family protein
VVVNSTRADRIVDPRYSQGDDWAALLARLDESGVAHSERHLTSSETAAADILRVAEEVAAELIVVGLRKRTPVGKLLLGSTAQAVILHAPCPVVAVKPA